MLRICLRYVCIVTHHQYSCSYNSTLVFIFCLHRTTRSFRGEISGTSHVSPGHAHSTIYACGLLDFWYMLELFKTPYSPGVSYKFFSQLLIFLMVTNAISSCDIKQLSLIVLTNCPGLKDNSPWVNSESDKIKTSPVSEGF